MKPIVLKSTTLNRVAYDAGRKLLQIEFRGGVVYHYVGVPAEAYEALLAAPSKGGYFNRVIRGRFAYARQTAARPLS